MIEWMKCTFPCDLLTLHWFVAISMKHRLLFCGGNSLGCCFPSTKKDWIDRCTYIYIIKIYLFLYALFLLNLILIILCYFVSKFKYFPRCTTDDSGMNVRYNLKSLLRIFRCFSASDFPNPFLFDSPSTQDKENLPMQHHIKNTYFIPSEYF